MGCAGSRIPGERKRTGGPKGLRYPGWTASSAVWSPTMIQSASESNSRSARALRVISAPTPAGSPIVIAILGRRTGPPTVDLAAAIEYVGESLAGTEAAGFGDDDAAVGDATLNDAPGNTGSEFTGQQDAGRVERFKDERRGLAASEDQSGSRGGGKGFANFVVRRAGPVDAVNCAARRIAM